ncbi:MAG: hypothetical protein DSM107014_15170, partial [Gomphosphaeria aponina SAG 52.96 = DSM 107014]|nr:hypothetical protein [Gomphosphaeria aponina SAG 52.96 = DSM 107014]
VEQYIIEREQIGARISEIETRFNLSNLPPLPEYDYQTIASIFGVKYRQIYELIGIPKTQVRRRSKALNILIKVLQDDNADFFNLLNT